MWFVDAQYANTLLGMDMFVSSTGAVFFQPSRWALWLNNISTRPLTLYHGKGLTRSPTLWLTLWDDKYNTIYVQAIKRDFDPKGILFNLDGLEY